MKKQLIYIGRLPDVFGYGICVVSKSKAGAMRALRKGYNDWKAARPNSATTFESSFEYYGGYVEAVEIGKPYADGFTA